MAIAISYTVFAIPNKYDASATIKVKNQVSMYEDKIKSNDTIKYVCKRYDFSKQEVISSLNVTHADLKIAIRSRTKDAIESKKIVDSVVTYMTKNDSSIKIISNAVVAKKRSSPNLVLNGIIGGICGLVLGIIFKLIIAHIKG